jgi:EAL domain-containing protein (putative c-di-GMP-specific phosphodiesterase class I)
LIETLPDLALDGPELARTITLENRLARALARDELDLHYQTIWGADGKTLCGLEALVRWKMPYCGTIPPDLFIRVAEQCNLVCDIDRWVFMRACRDLASLHRRGLTSIVMHVNMTAQDFEQTGLVDDLLSALDEYGLHPWQFCLELTERSAMENAERVIPVINRLRNHGFGFALDDFGTGYSSLSRLKRLPVTSIKIDRSFMAGVPHKRVDSAIVRMILDLGRHLHLPVVAEGVESDAQTSYLRQFGCEYFQGYFFGKPQPLDELMAGRHAIAARAVEQLRVA